MSDYIISKTRKLVSVTIDWSKAIDVEKFKFNHEMTKSEQTIATTEQVVYIFYGENKNGAEATDIGQTSRSLEVRIKEHLRDGDYLEGFRNDSRVFCGNVSSHIGVDRDLLEQVEGILIQFLNENSKDRYICNQSKLNTCKEVYQIEEIWNKNMPADLGDILPSCICVND